VEGPECLIPSRGVVPKLAVGIIIEQAFVPGPLGPGAGVPFSYHSAGAASRPGRSDPDGLLPSDAEGLYCTACRNVGVEESTWNRGV
jgi:hypothetical protein